MEEEEEEVMRALFSILAYLYYKMTDTFFKQKKPNNLKKISKTEMTQQKIRKYMATGAIKIKSLVSNLMPATSIF